ncbi:hypothetical protein AO070_18980 [Pseudomonas syringae pv. syringae PD2766]|nr:hypothetical protein AO070_18980 [Pseudomonas syringae pv. syringae PD2766]
MVQKERRILWRVLLAELNLELTLQMMVWIIWLHVIYLAKPTQANFLLTNQSYEGFCKVKLL